MRTYDEGTCSGPNCGKEIWWIKVVGKPLPVDPQPRSMIVDNDGVWMRVQAWTPHHQTCVDVARFKKGKS